jgi:hypothetical protein
VAETLHQTDEATRGRQATQWSTTGSRRAETQSERRGPMISGSAHQVSHQLDDLLRAAEPAPGLAVPERRGARSAGRTAGRSTRVQVSRAEGETNSPTFASGEEHWVTMSWSDSMGSRPRRRLIILPSMGDQAHVMPAALNPPRQGQEKGKLFAGRLKTRALQSESTSLGGGRGGASTVPGGSLNRTEE